MTKAREQRAAADTSTLANKGRSASPPAPPAGTRKTAPLGCPPSSQYTFLLNEAHRNGGDYLNKALTGIESANTSLYEVLEHIDFTRKVGQSKIPDIKLRQLVTHFGSYRLRNEDFEFPDLLGATYAYELEGAAP